MSLRDKINTIIDEKVATLPVGKSAYEIYIAAQTAAHGIVLSQEAWLASLKGADGVTPRKGVDYNDGIDGRTPVKGVDYFDGNPGAASTVPGPKGDQGDPGPKGDPGIIQDISGKVDKVTNKSLVLDTEISKIHAVGSDNQDLSGLQPKETGKGLSANDLTSALKTSYDGAVTHAGSVHAPSNAQKNSDITGAEIEAKLTGTISTHSHTITSPAFNSVYRTLLDSSGSHIATKVAGTYGMGQGDPLAVTGTGTLYPLNTIYIAAADYLTIDSKVTKLRIRAIIECNDVAPFTGTFTIGLHPVTRPATSGGAGLCIYTIGAAVAGSTAIGTNLAADSQNQLVGADFALPADGFYVIGVVTSATMATSAHCHISASLQIHNN
jgi:hypothetical protein